MENEVTRLLQRYFRKTKAHPEGSVTHHGDCDFFNIKVCTCGLHHDLQPMSPDKQEEHYPLFQEELADYEGVRGDLMGHTKHHSRKH